MYAWQCNFDYILPLYIKANIDKYTRILCIGDGDNLFITKAFFINFDAAFYAIFISIL